MDPIKEVAKATCPVCYEVQDVLVEALSGFCEACNNTILRWPTLSRECPGCNGTRQCVWGGNVGADCACKTGRIPDVTLEKVLDIVDTLYLDKYCDGWQCWVVIEDNDGTGRGYAATEYPAIPLEAACAALLEVPCPIPGP